jgi:error-prone DNA polymerase
LKGVSVEEVKLIVLTREQGRFTSLRDFVLRADVSQPVLENLVRVGAFDSLGTRNELLLNLPQLMNMKQKVLRGTNPMLDEATPDHKFENESPSVDTKARMLIERELLSLNLSAHPLDFSHLEDGFTKMKDLPSIPTGKVIKIAGSVIRYQTPPTRNGKRVVYVIMEDGTGIADVTVFSDVQEKCGHVLFRAGWLVVKGKVQRRGQKSVSVIAEALSDMEPIG